MNVIGLLVTYSPQYFQAAIDNFATLIGDISHDGKIFVINNNPIISVNDSRVFNVISGDNILHEFGAWQKGLDLILSFEKIPSDTLVVFGNDTLCHHRAFHSIERHAFARAFRKAARTSTPVLSGQQSTFHHTFRLQEAEIRSWVCTYLFAANGPLLESLDRTVCSHTLDLSVLVPGGEFEEDFFSHTLDPVLRQHLTAWLFGRPGFDKWRQSSPLSRSNANAMRQKAFSIMNEKLLTARSVRAGAKIADPLRSPSIRTLKGFRKLFGYISP